MAIALLCQSTGIEQQHSVYVHLQPSRRRRISIVPIYILRKFRSYYSSIPVPCQIHFLILQLGKLLVEPQKRSKIFNLRDVVIELSLDTDSVSHSRRPLDVEHIRLFVPVVRIEPEICSISREGELSLGIEPAVKGRASWPGRDHHDERIFRGVVFRWRIHVI